MTGLKINTACTCPNWEGGTDRVSKWAGFMLAVYVGPFVRRSMLPVSKLWLFKAPSTLASKSLTTGPKIAAIPSAITVADSSSDFFVLSLTTLVSGAHAASVMFFLPSSSSSSSSLEQWLPSLIRSAHTFHLICFYKHAFPTRKIERLAMRPSFLRLQCSSIKTDNENCMQEKSSRILKRSQVSLNPNLCLHNQATGITQECKHKFYISAYG